MNRLSLALALALLGLSPAAAQATDPNPEDFVVLAISGGGARATSFGCGAVTALRATKLGEGNLLDAVDVVAGTSGGALIATQLALDPSAEGVAAFEKAALEENLSKAWRRSVLKNSPKLVKKGLSRADLMARLVGKFYADKSWEDLPGHPRLFLTTVDMGTGKLFPWTASAIKRHGLAPQDLLLGRTATASMAPPGAMLPLTFKLHEGREVQLMDGGVVDNMALSAFTLAPIPKGTKRVLVISINARRGYTAATAKEATLQSSKKQPEILQLRIDDLMRQATRRRLKLLEAQAKLGGGSLATAFVEIEFSQSEDAEALNKIKTWFSIDAKAVELVKREGERLTTARKADLLAPWKK
jgi:predicted acylesterase/phospholipase RssA